MTMQRFTNDEIDALLTQQTPSVRGGDAEVASLIADLRHAFHPTTPPAPTAELAAYLDPTLLAARLADNAATAPIPTPAAQPSVPTRSAPSQHTVRTRRLVVWLSGLGLAGQVGLGATAAVAAVAGAGAAGALPDPAQTVFNEVVATLVPGADTDTSPSDSSDDTPVLEDSSAPALVTPTEDETNKPHRHKPTPDEQNTPAKQHPDSDSETQPVVRNPQAPSDDDDTGVEDEAEEQAEDQAQEQADEMDDTRDAAEDQADTTADDPDADAPTDTVDPPETTGGDPSVVQNPDETTADDALDSSVEMTAEPAAGDQ